MLRVRVRNCVARAGIVGTRDGNIGAVSRATGAQFRQAVDGHLQGMADGYRSKRLVLRAFEALAQYAGVFPPPLVSDYSSDDEALPSLRSADSTDVAD